MDASIRRAKRAAADAESADRPRKEQIVSIATNLFARKGYEGTSLRDIAEAAGLTKAALYYHFPDKEKLYEGVVVTRMQGLNDTVQAAIAQANDPVEKIRLFLVASAARMDEDRSGWLASSNKFWSIDTPETRSAIVVLRDAFEHLLRDLVNDAIAQGRLRPVDPASLGRLLLSGLNLIPRWHKPDGPLTAVQVVEQYLDMILTGTEIGKPSKTGGSAGS